MFRIGDFSKLSQVSVKALRHYDDLGLFKPASVDRFTGYRYYSIEQLPRLNRLLALKDLGFSLEQIAPLLDEELPVEQIRALLERRRAELRERVQEEQARLARVEARLSIFTQEAHMPAYEVVLRQVEPLTVVAAREVVATIGQMSERCQALCQQLGEYMGRHGLQGQGPWFALYHNTEYTEQDIDVEMAAPVTAPAGAGPGPNPGEVGLRTLPGAQAMACTVHQGSFDTIGGAYAAIGQWVQANGYRVAGLYREVYLRGPGEGEPITEIQVPVERNS